MQTVLITVSIEVTEGQIEDLMDNVGAEDEFSGKPSDTPSLLRPSRPSPHYTRSR